MHHREYIAQMDARRIRKQSDHDIRGVNQLAHHLGGFCIRRKPEFSMRVIVEESELISREDESPTEFLGDLQYVHECTTLLETILSLPLCQCVPHERTFSIALAHAIRQDIKDSRHRNPSLLKNFPH
jgi:hypothetical protein